MHTRARAPVLFLIWTTPHFLSSLNEDLSWHVRVSIGRCDYLEVWLYQFGRKSNAHFLSSTNEASPVVTKRHILCAAASAVFLHVPLEPGKCFPTVGS